MEFRFKKSDYKEQMDACVKGENCINPKCCEIGKRNRKKIEQYESDLYRLGKSTVGNDKLRKAYFDMLSEAMKARGKRDAAEGITY